jgi:hypothetical protein
VGIHKFYLDRVSKYIPVRRHGSGADNGSERSLLAERPRRVGGVRAVGRFNLGANMMPTMLMWTLFLSGVTMATFAASGVFFLKLWKASHDRFFLGFALACWLLSLERVAGLYVSSTLQNLRANTSESSIWIYLIRLLAFATILAVVIDKNRKQKKSR